VVTFDGENRVVGFVLEVTRRKDMRTTVPSDISSPASRLGQGHRCRSRFMRFATISRNASSASIRLPGKFQSADFNSGWKGTPRHRWPKGVFDEPLSKARRCLGKRECSEEGRRATRRRTSRSAE
jgi:hypothetical protein